MVWSVDRFRGRMDRYFQSRLQLARVRVQLYSSEICSEAVGPGILLSLDRRLCLSLSHLTCSRDEVVSRT